MDNQKIHNLIKDLIEKTGVTVLAIDVAEDGPHSTWFKVEVNEPHFFIAQEGEALYALNHLVRRMIEDKNLTLNPLLVKERGEENAILIDINGFQKKRVEGIRAIAHMMGER